jgi:ceramide glucosyltransferase
MMIALCGVAALYLVSLWLRTALTLSYARGLPPPSVDPLAPDTLTIAQAILSGDPLLEARLEENLAALGDQRFLWLIDEEDTEARRIANRLARPALQVVLCPPCPDRINPKLWKLAMASPRVATPFFAVIDDDTTLPPASATALVDAARSHTVATGLPCYGGTGLPSALLAQFVNNNSLFTYLGTSRLRRPFTLNGMGYVMRTEKLARIGHFKPILGELTDDLALATLVLAGGGDIHQSPAPLYVQTGVQGLRHYWQMMHRWYVFTLLLMRRQTASTQALIFLLHGLPPMLLIAIFALFAAEASRHPWLLLAPLALLVARGLVIGGLQRRFFHRRLHRPVLSVLSELLQPLHLFHALSQRTIRWRTRVYHVRDTNDFGSA